MCHNPDKKYLKDLLDDYKETVHLLSNEMKPERERSVCRAFLRCAGILFTELRSVAPRYEPPDVLFDSARFEVLEVMNEGRLRDSEWKEKVQRVKKAKSSDDILLPRPSPKFIRLAELIPLVTDKLKNKFEKYGKRLCGDLDALVYVNRLDASYMPTSLGVFTEEYDTKNLDVQGWRSVSVLTSFSPAEYPDLLHLLSRRAMHAIVLTATNTAPNFIRERVGKILNEYPDQERLFEP